MYKPSDFSGKTVLITGAVRNTGLEIAKAFARERATVILNGRKAEDVSRVANNLRKTFQAKIIEAVADISRPNEVQAMFERIRNECGKLDILVNNAVIQGTGYSFSDTPLELLDEVFRINVFGLYHCSQLAACMMQEKGSGTIIHIGSNTGNRSIKDRSAYVASKAAVHSLNRAMAIELGPKGIRVNCIVAGFIHTERWASLTTEAERRRTNIPLGKEANGEDISNAVLFLASDRASSINGIELTIDGGVSAQLFPRDCDV